MMMKTKKKNEVSYKLSKGYHNKFFNFNLGSLWMFKITILFSKVIELKANLFKHFYLRKPKIYTCIIYTIFLYFFI